MKIWIDLHGSPGSQNGFDNSGHKVNTPGWQQGDTVAQTLEVIANITSKYAQSSYQDVVVGIELINEPLSSSLNLTTLQQYYRDGFDLTRDVSDTVVILQDGFNAPNTWNGFLSTSDNNAQNGKCLACKHCQLSLPSPLFQVPRQPANLYRSCRRSSRVPMLHQ